MVAACGNESPSRRIVYRCFFFKLHQYSGVRGQRCQHGTTNNIAYSSSMKWKHASIPRPKKPRSSLKRNKQLATVFWNIQSILFWEWLEPGRTINRDQYCEIDKTLRRRFQHCHPGKWTGHMLLQHDNARPHNNQNTRATLAALDFTVFLYPRYLPYQATLDYGLRLVWQDDGHSPEPTNLIF